MAIIDNLLRYFHGRGSAESERRNLLVLRERPFEKFAQAYEVQLRLIVRDLQHAKLEFENTRNSWVPVFKEYYQFLNARFDGLGPEDRLSVVMRKVKDPIVSRNVKGAVDCFSHLTLKAYQAEHLCTDGTYDDLVRLLESACNDAEIMKKHLAVVNDHLRTESMTRRVA